MDREDIGVILPRIPVESWKFARALPPGLFADMLLSDHYHVEEFIEQMKSPVILRSEPALRLPSDET